VIFLKKKTETRKPKKEFGHPPVLLDVDVYGSHVTISALNWYYYHVFNNLERSYATSITRKGTSGK
jgi:hypothetical protein